MNQKIIVGIDEAGRGPLAGPVIAAALVILDTPKSYASGQAKYNILDIGVRDSKTLSEKQRERIYKQLHKNPFVEWGIGRVSEKQIDRINIYQATRLAMKKAVLSLNRKLCRVSETLHINSLIVDGNMVLDVPIRQKAVVKADATISECMAASIIAKVTRDRLMMRYHTQYPQYGFDRHKGYGTAHHMAMLHLHGPSPIHRLSFAPCRKLYNMVH